MHQEHHRRGQLVDEEEHVDHHRRSTQHARRDRDGPAKAGKVHSDSEQEAPATRDPEEDKGS
jgi:hypothetical protein